MVIATVCGYPRLHKPKCLYYTSINESEPVFNTFTKPSRYNWKKILRIGKLLPKVSVTRLT